MDELTIVAFPLDVVKAVRLTHDVPYQNNRHYDYAMGPSTGTPAIPWCLNHWAINGLDLSKSFVWGMWDQVAVKRGDDSRIGELHRCAKLTLDAFAHVYDIAALSELGNMQVRYTSSNDLKGIDYHVIHADFGVVSLQMSRAASSRDYRGIKQERRVHRNTNGRAVVDLRVVNLDTKAQPWVPTDDWYRKAPELIALSLQEIA